MNKSLYWHNRHYLGTLFLLSWRRSPFCIDMNKFQVYSRRTDNYKFHKEKWWSRTHQYLKKKRKCSEWYSLDILQLSLSIAKNIEKSNYTLNEFLHLTRSRKRHTIWTLGKHRSVYTRWKACWRGEGWLICSKYALNSIVDIQDRGWVCPFGMKWHKRKLHIWWINIFSKDYNSGQVRGTLM